MASALARRRREPSRTCKSSRTPAHIRLIFEELFFLELGLELKTARAESANRNRLPAGQPACARRSRRFCHFHPTAAQKRVLKEIASDMEKPFPMRRLLQGDVGSGKTIVAFEAAIIAMENGYQVALMAPTEILAQQHYFSARRILENAGYRIVLLTGSLEEDRKREIRRHIAQGNAQLVIGTHALHRRESRVRQIGLVIVDEQHRFGVMQRLKLMKKSADEKAERLRVRGTAAPVRPAGHSSAVLRRARRPGHDGHADSPHAGADALRRSRCQRARRNAAGPDTHRHPARFRRARRAKSGSSCASKSLPATGLRRLPVIEENEES